MAWVDVAVCLFFGWLGVHKLKEKKIGMGLLYLCTFGLFGFGWIYDCIRYVLIAVNTMKKNEYAGNDVAAVDESGLTEKSCKILRAVRKIGFWCLTILFVILALAFLPSIASVIAVVVAALTLPLQKWQDLIGKYIKTTWKTALIVVLAILTLIAAPAAVAPNTVDVPTGGVTITTTDRAVKTTRSTAHGTTTNTTVSTKKAATTTTNVTTATTITTVHTTISPTTTAPTHTHNYAVANCTTPKTCTSCGATEGYALGHHYTNGECLTCGVNDPDYVSESMVWIPTNGGKKYHTYAGCSNMVNPEQVTEEEAERRGFTP